MFKPTVPFQYKTPFNACQAAVNDGSTFATQSVVLACSDYTVNNKTEAVFANFKYNVSDQTFVQFGVREQEISAYASNYFFLPLTALVGPADGGAVHLN